MIRSFFHALSAAALLGITSQAGAQIIVPNPLQRPKGPAPKVQGQPELQKLLEQDIFQQLQQLQQLQKQRMDEIERMLQPRRRPGLPGSPAWGGAQLRTPMAAEVEQFGLPENEGLVVTAIDANSASQKAGLKVNDVLVKVNKKTVPSDLDGLAKLLKDQDEGKALDLSVLREGKETALNGAKLPLTLQAGVADVPVPQPLPGGFPFPMIPLGGINPMPQAGIQDLNLEMTINGAKISRRQKNDEFSGEYAKNELRITVKGTIKNGISTPSEITINDGKEAKKYQSLRDVPARHQPIVQQLMPSPIVNMLFQFPGLPLFPNE